MYRVIIHGRAYDVTEFKEEHPGGKAIILRWAGKDATDTYDPIHPPDTLDKYCPSSCASAWFETEKLKG